MNPSSSLPTPAGEGKPEGDAGGKLASPRRSYRTGETNSSPVPVDPALGATQPPAGGIKTGSPVVRFLFRSLLALYVLAMVGLAGLWYLTVYTKPANAPAAPTELLEPIPTTQP